MNAKSSKKFRTIFVNVEKNTKYLRCYGNIKNNVYVENGRI